MPVEYKAVNGLEKINKRGKIPLKSLVPQGAEQMPALQYSLSQIEAFACIAEQGSLLKAAIFLGKDRTTLRDLLDYLEDALGYRLFFREGRRLILTPEGQQLHRQAHLLLRQALAFEGYARSLHAPEQQELTMVYDPFIPAGVIGAITALMSEKEVRFSAWSGSRQEAEAALKQGEAQLALCQANHRVLGMEMEWCALGSVALDFYAASGLLQGRPQPLTLLDLSVLPQLVMHRSREEQITRRLQISGQTLFANERSTLRAMLESGQGWGFLPTHFRASDWRQVVTLDSEVGHQGLSLTMVAIWLPGAAKQPVLQSLISQLPALWQSAHHG